MPPGDGFNPRTYIRYDFAPLLFVDTINDGFNPRTYIRYDLNINSIVYLQKVSIHVPI